MKMHWLICFVACILFVSKPAICQESQADGKQDPKVESKKDEKPLFDAVVEQMEKRYFDKEFRTNELPKIVERYRPLAEKAETHLHGSHAIDLPEGVSYAKEPSFSGQTYFWHL